MSSAVDPAEDDARTSPSGTGFLVRHRLKIAASLVVAAASVWVLYMGALPLVPGREAFALVRWWTVPAYVALWCGVHYLRAIRWTWLLAPLHPVPAGKLVAVSFIGFAAIQILPLRTGEAVRPVLIRRKGRLSGWAATGTIAAERIIDGLFLSVMLLVALGTATVLDPLPDRIGNLPVSASVVPRAAYGALALFGAAFLAMGVFYFWRRPARAVLARVVGLVSPPLAAWLAERVDRVASGLGFLPRLSLLTPFVVVTAVYWLLNAAATWLLGWGCGFHGMSYAQACAVTGILALGILVPNAPGYFGAYQIAVYAGLAMFFPAEAVVGPGAAYVFLVYVAQLLVTLGGAALGMLMERTTLAEALAPEAA